MKRILSLLLIFTMIFALASCSGKDDGETTAPPPVIEENSHSKEFRNSEGTVVFTVDVAVPQIAENCEEKVKNYINGLCLEIFEDACDFAESNLENATDFMKSTGSTTPWSKKITFETTYLSPRYACFIVKDAFSYFGKNDSPVWSTKCFDIKTGELCTLDDFSLYTDAPSDGYDFFLSNILAPALETDFIHPEYITPEVLGRVDEITDYEDFYLTDNGMGFYFNKNKVHEFLNGMFKIEFTWEDLMSVYELPAE